MSQVAVQDILRQIEQLGDDDRVLLQERLDTLFENEWQKEAASAQRAARQQGIDEAAIMKAIRDHRRSA